MAFVASKASKATNKVAKKCVRNKNCIEKSDKLP